MNTEKISSITSQIIAFICKMIILCLGVAFVLAYVPQIRSYFYVLNDSGKYIETGLTAFALILLYFAAFFYMNRAKQRAIKGVSFLYALIPLFSIRISYLILTHGYAAILWGFGCALGLFFLALVLSLMLKSDLRVSFFLFNILALIGIFFNIINMFSGWVKEDALWPNIYWGIVAFGFMLVEFQDFFYTLIESNEDEVDINYIISASTVNLMCSVLLCGVVYDALYKCIIKIVTFRIHFIKSSES